MGTIKTYNLGDVILLEKHGYYFLAIVVSQVYESMVVQWRMFSTRTWILNTNDFNVTLISKNEFTIKEINRRNYFLPTNRTDAGA